MEPRPLHSSLGHDTVNLHFPPSRRKHRGKKKYPSDFSQLSWSLLGLLLWDFLFILFYIFVNESSRVFEHLPWGVTITIRCLASPHVASPQELKKS